MKIILLSKGKKPVANIEQINHCFPMLSYGLDLAFKKLGHETLQVSQDDYIKKGIIDFSNFPQSDIVIHSTISEGFTPETYKQIKTKCKKYVSFFETITPYCDFSFSIKQKDNIKNHSIFAPYSPDFYQNIAKEPNTILLDHPYILYWVGNNTYRDISRQIWKWLEPLKNRYKIYTLTKQGIDASGDWKAQTLKALPKYITPIYDDVNPLESRQTFNFKRYLEVTDRFENFVVTVWGSYNFSVIDMIVRGIRVLSPPNFIPNDSIRNFKIPTFENQEQLIKTLEVPIDKNLLQYQFEQCTPMNKVADIILEYFNKWIE